MERLREIDEEIEAAKATLQKLKATRSDHVSAERQKRTESRARQWFASLPDPPYPASLKTTTITEYHTVRYIRVSDPIGRSWSEDYVHTFSSGWVRRDLAWDGDSWVHRSHSIDAEF